MSQLFCGRCSSYMPGHHHDVQCPNAHPDPEVEAKIAAFVDEAIKEADLDARRARWQLGFAIMLACSVSWLMGACMALGEVCK